MRSWTDTSAALAVSSSALPSRRRLPTRAEAAAAERRRAAFRERLWTFRLPISFSREQLRRVGPGFEVRLPGVDLAE